MSNRYGLQIRAAAATDAPGLAELWAAAGHTVAAGALAERLDRLYRVAGSTVLIAMEWGPLSGVVALSVVPSLRADLPQARIDLLLVAPDERRRGIGRTLLKAASQAARAAGCCSLALDASSGDEASLHVFCAATGFAAAGTSYARSLRKKS